MDRDWTASFSIRFRNGTCIIILDKKYNITNSSCHFGSYGSIWTGSSPKKILYGPSFGPYNIFLVTDRSIYSHMTLSAMNYLLFMLIMRTTSVLACTTYCNILGTTNSAPMTATPNKPRSIEI